MNCYKLHAMFWKEGEESYQIDIIRFNTQFDYFSIYIIPFFRNILRDTQYIAKKRLF